MCFLCPINISFQQTNCQQYVKELIKIKGGGVEDFVKLQHCFMCVSSKFPQKKLWLEDFVETEALYDVYIINFT